MSDEVRYTGSAEDAAEVEESTVDPQFYFGLAVVGSAGDTDTSAPIKTDHIDHHPDVCPDTE